LSTRSAPHARSSAGTEVIVVGSQSILGPFREDQLPTDATRSVEIDILPIADDNSETERLADVIEGVAGEFLVRGAPRVQHRRRRPHHVRPADRLARLARQSPERQYSGTRRRASIHRLVPRQGRPMRRQALRFPGKGPEFRGGARTILARRPRHHPFPARLRGRALPPSGRGGHLVAPFAMNS
jgi:hypothetical protein